MCTDIILLQKFIDLKGKDSEETKITIDDLRRKAIVEGRVNLVKKYISMEWEEIDKNKDYGSEIKVIVKEYLMDISERSVFIEIYNYLQELIENAGDILYFLNPLRFPKYEIDAIKIIRVDPNLNYSGFISACKVKSIDNNILESFIQRLCNNKQKYEKIINKRRNPPMYSSSY